MTLDATGIFLEGWAEGWTPDPDYLVADWAQAHRMLSGKGAAEPGPWRNERTPYAVEPMNRLSPQDPVQRVVLMWGSQVGKTESANNWLGFVMHHAPGPFLFVQATLNDLKKNVVQRINPMIAETPALRDLVASPRAKDAANNMYVKEFPGGMLLLTGANSASGLASMPIRYLYCDEIDRWPHDVEGEGDPVELAARRTVSFQSRKKILLTSTPTIKGLSRIESEFKRSDQRRYFVPCPHCGHRQHLRWRDEDGTPRLLWDKDAEGRHLPNTARYLCEACEVLIEEKDKPAMLAAGQWVATAAGDGLTAGYHLNALYSPFQRWRDIVAEFLAKKDYRERLKEWTNTVLAETWEEEGTGVQASALAKRLESYERNVAPEKAAVAVNAIDVQGDRLECKTVAYGPGEESWLLDYEIIWGDPSTDPTVWERAEEWRRRELVHAATGHLFRAAATFVDTGDGNHLDATYDYIGPRQRDGVFAVKGKDYISRPGLAMESTTKRSHIRLFLVATFAAKDRIFSRLRNPKSGPGYMHLPDWVPGQYLDQLTAERKVATKNRRTGTLKVEYIRTGRNEALDLEVYCLAGLYALQHFIRPSAFRDLEQLLAVVTGAGAAPAGRGRRVRNRGIG